MKKNKNKPPEPENEPTELPKDEPTEPKDIKPGKTNKFWSSEKLMSFIALIVSVGTMFTYTYQNHLIKKHQYASVMPYLMIASYAGGKINGNRMEFSINVWNSGIGPAFVKEVKIEYEGKEYDGIVSFFNDKIYPSHPELRFSMNGAISDGYVLPVGTPSQIIGSNDSTSANYLEKIVENLDIEITYSSVYDETWKASVGGLKPLKIK